jgi:hypothetical protein
MSYPGEGKNGQVQEDYVLAAERMRAEGDLAHADMWEARARTKELPSTRTEIPGEGGGAMTGGWSKVSNEPLARECEPIERVRARLEALARANAAPRCGARSKRTGLPCRAAAMPNGRCKVHGGKSTGPRTPEGLERSRRANWKHGYYSREAKAERSRVRAAILALRCLRMLGH